MHCQIYSQPMSTTNTKQATKKNKHVLAICCSTDSWSTHKRLAGSFLATMRSTPVTEVQPNMYWDYGSVPLHPEYATVWDSIVVLHGVYIYIQYIHGMYMVYVYIHIWYLHGIYMVLHGICMVYTVNGITALHKFVNSCQLKSMLYKR